MEEDTKLVITFMICVTAVILGIFTMGAWVNTPTEFSTFHYVNIYADNETRDSLNSIARISESQDQQCIVKEVERLIDSETGELHSQYIYNEYMVENCSYTN